MESFDTLVLGGGTAGCVIAARLSEDESRRVCLVEAGPDYGRHSEGRWPKDSSTLSTCPTPMTGEIAMAASRYPISSRHYSSMAPALLERHLLRARDLIDGSYDEPLDLQAMAGAAHVSPRHFSRSFRRIFGETPYQYLLSRRLERARHLLRTTDQSVAEVCLSVGFTSVGSFTTTFTRHVGVSPTTYRRAHAAPSAVDYIPLCAVKAWARWPADGAFREDSARSAD